MSQAQKDDGENCRVVFLGLADPSEENIQAFSEKLSIRFGIPMEKALRIMENAPIVIKKAVSRSKAERFREVLVELGGRVRIEQPDRGMDAGSAQVGTGRVEGFETTTIQSSGPAAKSSGPESLKQSMPRDDDIAKAYDDDIAGAYEEGFTPQAPKESKPVTSVTFQCPQCGHEQQKGTECIKCGIIFDKYDRMVEGGTLGELDASQSGFEGQSLPQDFEVKIEPAGFWIRVGAYIVDGVVLNLMLAALAVGLFFLLGVGRNPRAMMSAGPMVYGVVLFVSFAYHVYFLGRKGYTPGKGFLGLQVIRQDGAGISYGEATIRTFAYIISWIPLMLGFLWVAFDRNKRGWHDKIAKTQVIKAEEVAAWRKWIILIPAILIPLIGVVSAIGIPVYMGYTSRADVAKAVSEMQTVKGHLEEYYYRYNRYPHTNEFRSFLRRRLGQIPEDPFTNGQPYRYKSDGSAFTLWSVGPDRVDNAAMIPYDPLRARSIRQKGDIILESDEGTDTSHDLFEMTPSSL